MKTQLFNVPKMHCSSCVMLIEGLEDELDGVHSISASYQKQQIIVKYDENKVSEAQIIAAAKQEGYDAIPV